MISTKAIVATLVAAGIGAAYVAKNKFSKYKETIAALDFTIKGVKNVKLPSRGLASFNVDIDILNPTSQSIDVPGEQIILRKLHFFTASGAFIGTAETNLSDLNFLANTTRRITSIPVTVSLGTMGTNIIELLDIVSDYSKLSIHAEIEAFGSSIIVVS